VARECLSDEVERLPQKNNDSWLLRMHYGNEMFAAGRCRKTEVEREILFENSAEPCAPMDLGRPSRK